jgi:hypothetical protein
LLIPAFFIYPSKGFNHSDGEEEGIFLDGFVKDQGASGECSGKKPNDVHTKGHKLSYIFADITNFIIISASSNRIIN